METRLTSEIANRRRHPRLIDATEHGVIEARVRPAYAVTVVDLSAGGVLVETHHRLMPNASVEVQFRTPAGQERVRGSVVRCTVVQVRAHAINYRGAICFDRSVTWLPAAPAEYPVPTSKNRSLLRSWADATHLQR